MRNRCFVCGNDMEQTYRMTLKINDKQFNLFRKLEEQTGQEFILVNKQKVIYPLVYVVDEINNKPINGWCYQVNFDCCIRCIDKIGRRDKFDKKTQKIKTRVNIKDNG